MASIPNLDLATDPEAPYAISDRNTMPVYRSKGDPRAGYNHDSVSLSAAAPVRWLVRKNLGEGQRGFAYFYIHRNSEYSENAKHKSKTANVAIDVVEVQLGLHQKQEERLRKKQDLGWEVPEVSSGEAGAGGGLFKSSLKKIEDVLSDDLESGMEAIQDLQDGNVKDAILSSPRIPFQVFMESQRDEVAAEARKVKDIDEWVLANEHHIRAYITSKPSSWSSFLLPLSSLPKAFSGSPSLATLDPSSHTLTFPRQQFPQGGFTILERKCPSERKIHLDVESFKKAWDRMTGGILSGLDWQNVCVAGGFPLAVLQNVQGGIEDEKHLSSDLDLYITGLDTPSELTSKLVHIAQTYKSNLQAGKEMLVTRNSRTVTFFSDYPTRRVQVVLKRTNSLAEVLLNFDLDPCAVGFDGKEVWMLPRMVRSLQTSCSIFTMDMPEGHWLGDRRESQDERIFKYANRGFGVHFLPSYLAALDRKQIDINAIAHKSRARFAWIFRRLVRYYGWNRVPNTKCEYGLGTPSPLYNKHPGIKIPIFSHGLLDNRDTRSAEPGDRNCLTSFGLLMRHVGLWETECDGKVLIDESCWASDEYQKSFNTWSYDDCPKYKWNEDFSLEGMKKAIEDYNKLEFKAFKSNLTHAGIESKEAYDSRGRKHDHPSSTSESKLIYGRPQLQRMAYSSSIEESLNSPIVFALFLPPRFADFAREMVAKVAEEGKIELDPEWLKEGLVAGETLSIETEEELQLYYWTLGTELMWQKVDRRLDETFEMLWAFFRANANLEYDPFVRDHIFRLGASRRAARPARTGDSERIAFVRWVETTGPMMDAYMAVEQGFFERDDAMFEHFYAGKPVRRSEDDDDDDDEEEEDGADWRPGWEEMNGLEEDGNGSS